jgi:hypothetical protein
MEPVLQHVIERPRLKAAKWQLFAPYDSKPMGLGMTYQLTLAAYIATTNTIT